LAFVGILIGLYAGSLRL